MYKISPEQAGSINIESAEVSPLETGKVLKDQEKIIKITSKAQAKVDTILKESPNIVGVMKEVWKKHEAEFLKTMQYSKVQKAFIVYTLANDTSLDKVLFDGKGSNVGNMLPAQIKKLYNNVCHILGLKKDDSPRNVLRKLGMSQENIWTMGLNIMK